MSSRWNARQWGGPIAAVLLASVALAGTLPDARFVLQAGHHYDSGCILAGPRAFALDTHLDRSVSFQCLFEPSCAYRTVNPVNQFSWNKLMGITTARIHHNSIRLGWRYDRTTAKISLGFYGYIKGNRIMKDLVEVDLGQWIDVRIEMTPNLESVTVNGTRIEENQSLGLSMFFPTPTWILRTAYFGGTETAPQDMAIEVRAIRID